jgi:preprotein translocase subunit SecG
MTVVITIIHVLLCIFLIIIVLLQSSKGSDLASTFGGASNTMFGSSGAASFLNKLTTIAAISFMFTSLLLAIISGMKPKSIITDKDLQKEALKPTATVIVTPNINPTVATNFTQEISSTVKATIATPKIETKITPKVEIKPASSPKPVNTKVTLPISTKVVIKPTTSPKPINTKAVVPTKVVSTPVVKADTPKPQ